MFLHTIKVILLVVVAVTFIGCSATPTRRSFKEGWKDSTVSTKVVYKFTTDKLVKKRNLDVDTWRGVVTLTGRVTSVEEKERAEQLAWQVKGVREVDNYLKLVDDAALDTGAVVAEKVTKSKVKEITPAGTRTKTRVTDDTVVAKRSVPNPTKAKVNNRVEGPVTYEEIETVKTDTELTAKRGRYSKPLSEQILEEDLTSEEKLANEAAEELKKLRGE